MKIAIISFTEHGCTLGQKLATELEKENFSCIAYAKMSRRIPEACDHVHMLEGSLKDWTKVQFENSDAVIFIGAAGIAVRSIAPFVKSKKTDPSVIVVDEQGKHVISLLSGHIGGANACTLLVAKILGAEPVITTATDLNEKFAVDEFAARRHLYIDNMAFAKEIAACLVAGEKIGMYSDFPVYGKVPEEIVYLQNRKVDEAEMCTEAADIGFSITVQKKRVFAHTLHLVPKVVTLGIGCKRDTKPDHLMQVLDEVMEEYEIFPESIKQIASIDLKKEEPAILNLAKRLDVPFYTYPAEELKEVSCVDGFTESDFVKSVTGVGGVCERAALRGAKTDKLLIRKRAKNGVTVAAAVENYAVWMDE